ncbi:MAG TPA: Rpn family recombination-promoting nuclease/putative transposase [Candidatus Mediterraneibacter intestinigallinarum]|nr:Rpn family recombination-promoting nuclease/putative transposase [Candidatus Mediterraneibacter intestinigallinarum]
MRKLPSQDQNEGGIIRWMRFLGGKKREEFEDMAKKDEYIEAAYDEMKKLSLDEQKRLEYELREKAIRDHNSLMKSAQRLGQKRGEEIGEERGERLALKRLVGKKMEKGMPQDEIAELLELEPDVVKELADEWVREQ